MTQVIHQVLVLPLKGSEGPRQSNTEHYGMKGRPKGGPLTRVRSFQDGPQ
jgi:hypothetical protein